MKLLSELLEERGVSCKTHYLHVSWCVGPKLYEAVDNLDGTLTVSGLTPEQAVTATLGGGECEKLPSLTDAVCIVRRGGMEMHFGYWRCSKCGCENFEGAKHCMNCGARVLRNTSKYSEIDAKAVGE